MFGKEVHYPVQPIVTNLAPAKKKDFFEYPPELPWVRLINEEEPRKRRRSYRAGVERERDWGMEPRLHPLENTTLIAEALSS